MENKLVRIKWIGPNDPRVTIERNDASLYLRKRELVALMEEIKDFVDFYKDDFGPERIDIETPDTEEDFTNALENLIAERSKKGS